MTPKLPPILSRSRSKRPELSSSGRRHFRRWRTVAYISSFVVSRLVPRRAGEWIADAASRIAHATKAGERLEVRLNLSVVMKSSSDSPEVMRAAKNVYVNFGRTCVDLLYETRTSPHPIPSNLKIENIDLLENAAAEGRGVILLGAHSGAWELGALALSSRGFPFMAPVQAPAGAWVSGLYRRERLRFGMKPLPSGEPMIKCARALKSGGIVGLLGDRAFGTAAVRTEFFGRPAYLPQGPARLSIACGSPILSASMRRAQDGAYVLRFLSRIDPPMERGRAILGEYQKRVAALLEAVIAEAPGQWFCFESLWGMTRGSGDEN